MFDLKVILGYFKSGAWTVEYVQTKEDYLEQRRRQQKNDIVVWSNGDSQIVTFLSDCETSTFTFEISGGIIKRRE